MAGSVTRCFEPLLAKQKSLTRAAFPIAVALGSKRRRSNPLLTFRYRIMCSDQKSVFPRRVAPFTTVAPSKVRVQEEGTRTHSQALNGAREASYSRPSKSKSSRLTTNNRPSRLSSVQRSRTRYHPRPTHTLLPLPCRRYAGSWLSRSYLPHTPSLKSIALSR